MKSSAYLFGEKVAYDFAQSQRESTNVEDRRNQEPLPDIQQIRENLQQSRNALDEQRKKLHGEYQQWHWPWSARPEQQKYVELSNQLSDATTNANKVVAEQRRVEDESARNYGAWVATQPPASPRSAAVERFVVDKLGPTPPPVKKPIRYFQPEPGQPFAREFNTPKQPDIAADTSHMMTAYAPTSIIEAQRQNLQNQKEMNDLREFSAAYYPNGSHGNFDRPGPSRGISPKNWSSRPTGVPNTQVAASQSRSPGTPLTPAKPIASTPFTPKPSLPIKPVAPRALGK
jgi:small-conductance mechanosensitive channel